MNKQDWTTSHCGLMLCTIQQTRELMPEVMPIIEELVPHLEHQPQDYVVDVKVHMLMPGEYPCIPNWHTDFVPRDKELNKLPDQITGDKMYLWVSGEPRTEFIKPPTKIVTKNYEWVEFTQRDAHRSVKSNIHTWRCFIRLIPKWFIHPATINIGTVRPHSQVYIDNPDRFHW